MHGDVFVAPHHATASGQRNDPGFRTISDFRMRRPASASRCFVQVLKVYREAGIVKVGRVAVEGTKVKANALRHKADELRANAGEREGTQARDPGTAGPCRNSGPRVVTGPAGRRSVRRSQREEKQMGRDCRTDEDPRNTPVSHQFNIQLYGASLSRSGRSRDFIPRQTCTRRFQ